MSRQNRQPGHTPHPSKSQPKYPHRPKGTYDRKSWDAPVQPCTYCDVCEPGSLFQCLGPGCREFFCNGRSITIASHIIHHLYQSGHRTVKLARQRNTPGSTISFLSQCCTCQEKNGHTVFSLGLSVKGVECQKCAQEVHRDWVPLVKNHAFIQDVLPTPSKGTARGVSKSTKDISSIIEQDVRQRSGKRDPRWPDEPRNLLLRYDNTHEYYCIIYPMQEREFAHSRTSTHSLSGEISILEENSTWILFSMPSAKGGRGRLNVGDPVQLNLVTPSEEALGEGVGRDIADYIVNVFSQDVTKVREVIGLVDKIDLEADPPKIRARIVDEEGMPGVPPPPTVGNSAERSTAVQVNWNETSHRRKRAALKMFNLSKDCMHPDIQNFILGNIPRHNANSSFHGRYNGYNPMTLMRLSTLRPPVLNESQQEAIDWAMNQRVAIIQGPPGTGKTRTLTALVCRLLDIESQERILVCAPSNAAVDHLYLSFRQARIDAVKVERMYAFPRTQGYANPVVSTARVICATCIGSASNLLELIDKFPIVLIDEATQASEAECLIPLVQGCQKLVLVGDHKQLGPVVVDGRAKAADLGYSMFERLVNLEASTKVLGYQYRMHPSIWEAPSQVFYPQLVKSVISVENSFREEVEFPWPRMYHPVMFLNTIWSEERSGTSWENRKEARRVVDCVVRLTNSNVKPDQIGVISFYTGQITRIRELLKGNGMPPHLSKVRVSTVDSFQGQEKDFILVSCVRGDSGGGIGFLSVKNRVNVAITRARCGLIVVGNASSLERHAPWDELIRHWRAQQYICDGLPAR